MAAGKHISFRLDHRVDFILRDYANFRNIPVSELVRLAIISFIEDEIDSKYFEAAVNWERVSERMNDVLKLYNWLGLEVPKY